MLLRQIASQLIRGGIGIAVQLRSGFRNRLHDLRRGANWVLVGREFAGVPDPELAFEIMSLFQEINARGTTVLVATHDRDMITRLGKRVINLEKGRVAES